MVAIEDGREQADIEPVLDGGEPLDREAVGLLLQALAQEGLQGRQHSLRSDQGAEIDFSAA